MKAWSPSDYCGPGNKLEKGKQRERWHLEQCTNELETLQGGEKAFEMIQKGDKGTGRKCRRQRGILGEYFDGIMVGRCKEDRIQICPKNGLHLLYS